jgi:hypothetical protein
VKTGIAFAAALLVLAAPARAQDCRARPGSAVIEVPLARSSLECKVAGEIDAISARFSERVCNADAAAEKSALAGVLGAWLNRELAQAGSIKARAERIRGLLEGNPDSAAFLGRLLQAAQVPVRGLAAGETVSLEHTLASRAPVRVGFADCYPRAALLSYAESLRTGLQSLLASLEAFWIEMPCGGQRLLPATESTSWTWMNTRLDAVSPSQPLHYASPAYQTELCAAPGAVSYDWRFAFGAGSRWQLVGAANGARVTVRANDEYLRQSRLGGSRLPDLALALDVVMDANLPGLGAPRSRGTAGVLTRYGVVDAPPLPQLSRYWIEDYRLGTGQGRLENVGIIDPGLMLQAADSDGVVIIEGRNFAQDARFRVGDAEMQVLERSVQGEQRRFKARTANVTRGAIETATPADPLWIPLFAHPVRRLAPFFIQDDLLRNTVGAVELGIGSPRVGALRVRVGGAAGESTLPQIEGAGLRLNVEDLRSQPHELSFSGGPGANQVTIKVGIPFESGGDELVGTYEPTVVYWVCETARVNKDRCSDGELGCLLEAIGDAINALPSCTSKGNWSEMRQAASGGESSRKPLRGQIDNFRIDLDITLALDGGGRLKLDKYAAKSSGSFSLDTRASDLVQTPDEVQALVIAEVDKTLGGNANLASALQGMVDTLNQTFATGFRIFGLSATSGVIFLDREGGR